MKSFQDRIYRYIFCKQGSSHKIKPWIGLSWLDTLKERFAKENDLIETYDDVILEVVSIDTFFLVFILVDALTAFCVCSNLVLAISIILSFSKLFVQLKKTAIMTV